MKHRAKISLFLLVFVISACAGKVDPITVSATTAAIVGEQAVITNGHYVQLCASKEIPAEKCVAWATWFRAFQQSYGAAHAAYKTAVAAGDITSAQDAANRIQALSNQLVLYYVYGR